MELKPFDLVTLVGTTGVHNIDKLQGLTFRIVYKANTQGLYYIHAYNPFSRIMQSDVFLVHHKNLQFVPVTDLQFHHRYVIELKYRSLIIDVWNSQDKELLEKAINDFDPKGINGDGLMNVLCIDMENKTVTERKK